MKKETLTKEAERIITKLSTGKSKRIQTSRYNPDCIFLVPTNGKYDDDRDLKINQKDVDELDNKNLIKKRKALSKSLSGGHYFFATKEAKGIFNI
jgi:tRNA(Ile2) C34 agmatinyltransferase TiaS